MSLMNNQGEVDNRFNIVTMCKDFGWTYEEYLNRPLWFDEIYRIKSKADTEYHKRKSQEQQA